MFSIINSSKNNYTKIAFTGNLLLFLTSILDMKATTL